jgi:hypothetical protein
MNKTPQERSTEIIRINSIYEVPPIDTLRAYPREKLLKLIFADNVSRNRDSIWKFLKRELPGFQIRFPGGDPEIILAKLITTEEVIACQHFFERCAQDYRKLGSQLIFQLAEHLGITLQPETLYATFSKVMSTKKQTGNMGPWHYSFHGFHCCFVNNNTNQVIEVPIVFGFEFGDLDPYFFTAFIKSTPAYNPLPVAIYEDYEDGRIINNTLLSLGKFEKINSIFNTPGIVVSNREKVNIPRHNMETFKKERSTFSLLKLFRLKRS